MASGLYGDRHPLYFALRAEPPAWLGAAVAISAVFAAMLLGSRPVLRAGMMALAAATIGLASAQFATWRAPPLDILPTHATILTGTVRSVEALPEGRRITLEPAQLDDAPTAITVAARAVAGQRSG